MKTNLFHPWLITILLFMAITAVSADSLSQEIGLQPVQKDTPLFNRKKDNEYGVKYQVKAVKIKGNPEILTPPETEAAVLYYGKIKLGNPAGEYGILIDFEGKDKQLWVDSDGDKNYTGEPSYAIFKSDRQIGANVYYSPTPLAFSVKYQTGDQVSKIPIQMELTYLVISRVEFEDYFSLKTRTWLIGVFEGKAGEQQLALVDSNDNGVFNDPDDLIYIDNDFDLAFNMKESKKQKAFKSLRLKSGEPKINYGPVPGKLLLEKDE